MVIYAALSQKMGYKRTKEKARKPSAVDHALVERSSGQWRR